MMNVKICILLLLLVPYTEAFQSVARIAAARKTAQQLQQYPRDNDNAALDQRYLDRLNLRDAELDDEPTLNKLLTLTEAHLNHIPFENLRLHGASPGPASLDSSQLARQILDQRRGGTCYELNGLFSVLLQQLGYAVQLQESVMLTDDGERHHLGLMAKCCDHASEWYVDVGLGESPLHPLEYKVHGAQETPEGMSSRFADDGENGVVLQWWKDGHWETRLRLLETANEASVLDFEPYLHDTFEHGSVFRRKPVACKLTRDQKVTLAGNTLKRTTKRFSDDEEVTTERLTCPIKVQETLQEEFNMPKREVLGVKVEKR